MGEVVFTTKNGQNFERPDTGMYHGILADIVDLGDVTVVYQGKSKVQPMVRFIWILDRNGKDGKPLSVTARYTTNLHEKSNLYKAVRQILNAPPPLELPSGSLIGQVRKLFIQRDTQKNAQGQVVSDFSNIIGISPADAGAVVHVPSDFVRDIHKPVDQQARFKKKTQQQAPTQPQAAYQPPVQPQGADVRF